MNNELNKLICLANLPKDMNNQDRKTNLDTLLNPDYGSIQIIKSYDNIYSYQNYELRKSIKI